MEPEKKTTNSAEVEEYQRLLSLRYTNPNFDPKSEERIKELQKKLFGEANVESI